MKNIAIILASGSGKRFGSSIPKQFSKLAGKQLIEYTLAVFDEIDEIDEVLIVTKSEHISRIEDLINKNLFYTKMKVIAGGEERYDSTYAALRSIEDKNANILIHDAVRPFVDQKIIKDCIEALSHSKAVDVAIDTTDTVIEVDGDYIKNIPDRSSLKLGQTPQAFHYKILKKAYSYFIADDKRNVTDDCGIVKKYLPEEKIYVVKGSQENFKVTHSQDLYLADNLIKDGFINKFNVDTSYGEYDLSGKTVVIIGSTSGIGEDIFKECKALNATVYGGSRREGNIDITKPETIKNFLKKIYNKEGKIDYIVNTSGYLVKSPLILMSEKDIRDSFQINYLGVIDLARISFSFLKESSGVLMNFTSSSFTRGRENYSLYSSTKAAVVNLTQALAEEWLFHGIKINVINPERTRTPMRITNFGNEPEETLLKSRDVARFSVACMMQKSTGKIFTIRQD